jgi:hypothetical protein
MPLQDGAVYHAPNGCHYRARKQTRRYAPGYVWTMVPPHLDQQGVSWPDYMEGCLFEEGGKLYHFIRVGLKPDFCNTGWTLNDLVPLTQNDIRLLKENPHA